MKIIFFLGVGLGGVGQGGWERRSEAFVKIPKKKKIGGGGDRGVGLGCQGGCERRSKVFVKLKKKIEGGGVGRGRGVERGGWGPIRGWGWGGGVARFEVCG